MRNVLTAVILVPVEVLPIERSCPGNRQNLVLAEKAAQADPRTLERLRTGLGLGIADEWNRLQHIEHEERRVMGEYVERWSGEKVSLGTVSD